MTDNKSEPDETVASGEHPERTLAIQCPVCGLEVTGGFDCCPNDGTRLIADPASDSTLSDRYDSLELIGEGGMSAIYKARHKLMKRTVAIKLLHSHFHKNPDLLRRFQKEAEAVSALSHENVVNVFDFGQLQHGQPYMVMSYISGKSLSQTIKQEGPLDLQRCLKIFTQVGLGLEHAHKKHIVHRDLKPTNVMLTKPEGAEEKAIIVDFGIAKFMAEGEKTVADLTKTGAVIGSPHYMSPEQCLGQEIDLPSDIYSFGCLMYEAPAGKPMFSGGSSLETMHKHVNEKPPALQTLNGNQAFKPHMQAIIHHAVEKDQRDRYQTAGEVVHDLLLLDESMKKGTVPKLSALKACSRLNIKPVPLALMSVFVIICGVQMYCWWPKPVPVQPQPGIVKTMEAADDPALARILRFYPDTTELSASAISEKGIHEIARLARLQKLTLRGCTVDNTALSALSSLKKLEELDLQDSNTDDMGLQALDKISTLKKLTVTGVSEKGIPAVAGLANLKTLVLKGCTADDNSLAALSKLKQLEELDLVDNKIDDKGMQALGQVSSLKKLTVTAKALTDAGFSSLTGLKNLEQFRVNGLRKLLGPGIRSLAELPNLNSLVLTSDAEEIPDSALKIISESLPNLTTLKLESTQLTDSGLSCLSQFKNLQRLSLSFSHGITDKGMSTLAAQHLKWLNLNGTEITDDGLKTLSHARGLEDLFFWHTRITDAGMPYLAKIKTLQVLHLTHTAVSDVGVSRLVGLENLGDLKLRDTKVTDDGLKLLKNFKHLKRLSLQDLPITDRGLDALANLPSLADLDLSATLITDAGLKKLEKLKSLRALYIKDCRSTTVKAKDELKRNMTDCHVERAVFMPSRAVE